MRSAGDDTPCPLPLEPTPLRRTARAPRGDSSRHTPRHPRWTINKQWLINQPVSPATDPESRIFQALADPTRRALFESLTRGEVAVKDLTARFFISQPAVSQHLAALKEAGLVRGRRDGRCVYYRVEPRGLKPLVDWLTHYRAFWTERMGRLEKVLEGMDQ